MSAPAASLLVADPSGNKRRVPIDPVPFRVGRHASSHLVLRDSRASRTHAEIVVENGEYVLNDAGSLHGTLVNGEKISRRKLCPQDRIEFGFADSYQLVFSFDGSELTRLAGQIAPAQPHGHGLGKLRAILEVARSLQTAFSTDDVLASVVDAALTITQTERGFLMLKEGDALITRIARDRHGHRLPDDDLRVPRRVIHKALHHRRELLSMNFDPLGGASPEHSVADLELRSVVCVPLVRLNRAATDSTNVISTAAETVGLLYMDSRGMAADLAGGNRELVQTLAIEASTILENARLLEEERVKQRIDEELNLARTIQQSLLPRSLPSTGWLRACGSSEPSHQVGGDYYDLMQSQEGWDLVLADVSGKGVSSALLASLLQGAFFAGGGPLEERLSRISRFMHERTSGDKYATIFSASVSRGGVMRYINAGHCAPRVLRADGTMELLDTTSTPVGLLAVVEFPSAECILRPGDRVLVYSDGVTEAENSAHEFFGRKRLRAAMQNAGPGCEALHDAVRQSVAEFTGGADQSDDMTILTIEYAG